MAKKPSDNVLVKLTDFFFVRWRLTLLLWILVLGIGATVYTSVIKREGFPPIQFPVTLVTGTYLVDDKNIVDEQVTQPISEILQEVEGVSKISTTANDNFFTAVVFFESGVVSSEGALRVESTIENSSVLPEQVNIDVSQIDPAGFLNEFDLLVSVYSTEATTVEKLEEVASFVEKDFVNDSQIKNAKTQKQLETGLNPTTGQERTVQSSFNLIILPNDQGDLTTYPAITVGIDRVSEEIDIIELSELAEDRIASMDLSQFGDNFRVVIGADFASSIETQVASLQSNLFTGLVAVVIVTFLLITWRASIITAIFMVTVMATTVLVLYIVGYTLNTITLFALVLSLGLFVDDATIVVESIYAHRSKKRTPRQAVHGAIKKISAASFAGTMTTVLVFLPLAFLSGILGEFIRLMPITVIIALVSSLTLSLILIPVLAKFILLNRSSDSWLTRHNPVIKFELAASKMVSSMPRLLKNNPVKGKLVMVSMIIMSIAFLAAAATFSSKLSFNIFPPSKDSDQIGFQITYPEGYTIEQAKQTATEVNEIVVNEIGENVVRITYGSFQQATARSADGLVQLVSFRERETKSPELIKTLQDAIDLRLQSEAVVRVTQFDAGPPSSQFPLSVQIFEEDVDKAFALADELRAYIDGAIVSRANGTTATIIESKPPSASSVSRSDGKRTLEVMGAFDANDTSGLLVAAEEYIKEKFTTEYLVSQGYSEDTLGFDFGQESENADSFASLIFVFPVALLLMYLLLATQFRSFLQPMLIFMAIPFTLFGVTAGLYFTDNALSFFVQVGLIGLIGIAVNNTILLTEYANQEKRAGVGTIDAISNAVQKRFRPLITTTLTTVVALLPLALSDPFWEALAFTVIFGLISSTFLVIFSFPYYYLGAEWLRMRFSKSTKKARKINREKKQDKNK